MSIATTTAIAIGVGAAGAIGGAAIASSGAKSAANTQADSATYAADLQKQEADAALAEQQRQYDTGQKNLAPWLAAGTGALSKLTAAPAFQAPNAVTEQNDPGYQFRLQQGQKALENSAAARGSLLSGGTAKSLNDYAQGSASNEYSNVYNRALQTYNENQNSQLALAGLGQNATSQANSLGTNLANNTASIDLTTGAQQGQQINNAAAARASGYAASGNIYGNLFSNLGTNVSQAILRGNNNSSSGGGLPIFGNPSAASTVY